MPVYEYECQQCGIRFEQLQKFTDSPVSSCPECGGEVKRLIHPVGIVFKGSGWYITDSRAKSPTTKRAEKKDDKDGSKAATTATTTSEKRAPEKSDGEG